MIGVVVSRSRTIDLVLSWLALLAVHVAAGRRLASDATGLGIVVATGVAANAGADNVVNGVRLGQQLARESAESAFTSSGRLSSGAIQDAQQIIRGTNVKNKELIQRL